MGLESLKALKDEYQAKIKADGETALKAHFKEFFAANPTFTSVRWKQYTPHFNDGDACVFSVHGVYAKIQDGSEEAGDYDDGYLSDYDLKEDHKSEAKALSDLESTLNDMDDVLQAVLGDHSQITITPDAVDIEEYEHD